MKINLGLEPHELERRVQIAVLDFPITQECSREKLAQFAFLEGYREALETLGKKLYEGVEEI